MKKDKDTDIFTSFQMFEEKFGTGNRYAEISSEQIEEIKKNGLPDFYIQYIEKNGLKEFNDGFFRFVNPLEFGDELSFVTGSKITNPLIRNAFGGFLVYSDGEFYNADIQTKNFSSLGDNLGVIVNTTLTYDYALRDIFYAEFFDYALEKLGKLTSDEIYAFVPAPAIGGEFVNKNIQVVKLKEHLHYLSQL